MSAPTVLLTGATGYIASHTWLALQSAGFKVLGLDNFSNSSPEVLSRLEALGGVPPAFEQVDVRDAGALDTVFERHRIDAVVHFAAFKAVGESTQKPLAYYANNIGGLLNLCQTMERHGCKALVFSSSATVYGKPERLPIREDSSLSTTNPYGATKLMGENILRDAEQADPALSIALLVAASVWAMASSENDTAIAARTTASFFMITPAGGAVAWRMIAAASGSDHRG